MMVVEVECPKCGRKVDINSWLLRPNRCSPDDWGRCIREPEWLNVKAEERETI